MQWGILVHWQGRWTGITASLSLPLLLKFLTFYAFKSAFKNVFPIILCLHFLIEKFPACSLCIGGGTGAISKQYVVVALNTLCEGIFLGS